jgi:hypothetical protein
LPGLQSPFEGLDIPLQAFLPSGDAEDEGEGQDPENGVGGEKINQISHDDNLLSVSLVNWETGKSVDWGSIHQSTDLPIYQLQLFHLIG